MVREIQTVLVFWEDFFEVLSEQSMQVGVGILFFPLKVIDNLLLA